jgi:DNA-directed RNA polymerase subunit RPC12/RpoP
VEGSLYRCGKCGREFASPVADSRLPCRFCDGTALRVGPNPWRACEDCGLSFAYPGYLPDGTPVCPRCGSKNVGRG